MALRVSLRTQTSGAALTHYALGGHALQVGHRLGRHLAVIVPLFVGFMGAPDDEAHHTDEANDLRENCLQVRETAHCAPAVCVWGGGGAHAGRRHCCAGVRIVRPVLP